MKRAFAVLLVLALAGVVGAQGAPERFMGTVQWLTGERMALALDGGPSVPVDLTGADQGTYQSLSPGDRVVVTGTVSPDRDRVIAISVDRIAN
jgi:hypothetical protein